MLCESGALFHSTTSKISQGRSRLYLQLLMWPDGLINAEFRIVSKLFVIRHGGTVRASNEANRDFSVKGSLGGNSMAGITQDVTCYQACDLTVCPTRGIL